jgi:hypothetical protein
MIKEKEQAYENYPKILFGGRGGRFTDSLRDDGAAGM